MKKATNSKNKGKISKLFPIMQEHLGKSMNLARIKLMSLLLEALVKAQTVNLVRLANAMPTTVDKESNMRRLQRFLASYALDFDLIARMIFSLLPVKCGLVLTGDTIFHGSIGRTDLFGGDFDQLIASIQTQIFTLPPNTLIAPGHDETTTVELEADINPYVRSSFT